MATLFEERNPMSISSLGEFTIDVTQEAATGLYHIGIASPKRKEVVRMVTNPGETPDQFGMRIKSMLRSLLNGEPSVLPQEKLDVQSDNMSSTKQSKSNKKSDTNV